MIVRTGEALVVLVLVALSACARPTDTADVVRWYVFRERSGAFDLAAQRCSSAEARIETVDLPSDADQQREQLVRRLAAGDPDVDVIGMDVIWTSEFARAGWLLPWEGAAANAARDGRLPATVESATDRGRLWAAPFTSNLQLLWYRKDRVPRPPRTWDEMIAAAEQLGADGKVQVQGERYEGLTVLFVSLLASAGGAVLDESGERVSLEDAPTRRALEILRRLATSSAADPALSTAREDDARLAFQAGGSSFMVNYGFVWPSIHEGAPDVARELAFARWPAIDPEQPSRPTIGGVNLGVSSRSRHPDRAFAAAACLAAPENQLVAAERGGLLPTAEAVFTSPRFRSAFPFGDVALDTLRDAVQRPKTPLYVDVSLAISRTLHPLADVDPERDVARLRERVGDALASRGLL